MTAPSRSRPRRVRFSRRARSPQIRQEQVIAGGTAMLRGDAERRTLGQKPVKTEGRPAPRNRAIVRAFSQAALRGSVSCRSSDRRQIPLVSIPISMGSDPVCPKGSCPRGAQGAWPCCVSRYGVKRGESPVWPWLSWTRQSWPDRHEKAGTGGRQCRIRHGLWPLRRRGARNNRDRGPCSVFPDSPQGA